MVTLNLTRSRGFIEPLFNQNNFSLADIIIFHIKGASRIIMISVIMSWYNAYQDQRANLKTS